MMADNWINLTLTTAPATLYSRQRMYAIVSDCAAF